MEMKHYTLILLGALALTSCKDWWKHDTTSQEENSDSTEVTVPETLIPDSTIWGHLGEDTGMSALQFITDKGDTMEVYRTSQYTGEDGKLLGDIRELTDHFALTLREGNETLGTAVNASQLERLWKQADTAPYDGWKLWNGHIVLSSQQKKEIGIISQLDTMDIEWLDDDSLVVTNQLNQRITFVKN